MQMFKQNFELLFVVIIAFFLCWQPSFAEHADPEYVYLTDITDRIIWISQKWGELGIDTRAISPVGGETPGIEINGVKYEKGLGTHSTSRIVLQTDGLYSIFEADIGTQGTVVFQIIAGGKTIYDSGIVRSNIPAKHVNVEIEGVYQIELIVSDGNDGYSSDIANWANARFKKTKNPPINFSQTKVNMAPFAKVVTSDPSRIEGTKARRLEEFPENDLFLETELSPSEDNYYYAPSDKNNGCIGLVWPENRLIRSVEIEFANNTQMPSTSQVNVQAWVSTLASHWGDDSLWQGEWQNLQGKIEVKENRWIFKVNSSKGDSRVIIPKFRKIRWVFPSDISNIPIKQLKAFTYADWDEAVLVIKTEKQTSNNNALLKMYNGQILDEKTGQECLNKQWDISKPIKLKVRYSKAKAWKSDRTMIRFDLQGRKFTVAVDDILKNQVVYLPEFNFLVSSLSADISIEEYRQKISNKKTILEKVSEKPDQTFENALQAVHLPLHDRGPMVVSLACDNHKIEIFKDGSLQYDNTPDDPTRMLSNRTSVSGTLSYRFGFSPKFGGKTASDVKRELIDGWLPIPKHTINDNGILYQQTTFMAPFDQKTTGDNLLNEEKYSLGVAQFLIQNTNEHENVVELSFDFISDRKKQEKAQIIKIIDKIAVVEANGLLLAAVDMRDVKLDCISKDGTLKLFGKLEPKQESYCTVYFPTWDIKSSKYSALIEKQHLLSKTKTYWHDIMEDAIEINIPDKMLQNIIYASQVHCLVAARNDKDGKFIAPWIASAAYGPLDSESHSIIRGMDYMGHSDFCGRSLDFFVDKYNPSGFMTHGYTLIGTGQHLWTLGEHFFLTQDSKWLADRASDVEQLCKWIARQRRKTQAVNKFNEKVPEYGLMPPGVVADPPSFIYSFFANGYYYAGINNATKALSEIKYNEIDKLKKDIAEFRESILRAYKWMQASAPVLPLNNGTWVPACSGDLYGYEPGLSYGPGVPLVELGAQVLIPQGVILPNSTEADWMMNYVEDNRFVEQNESGNYDLSDWFNVGGFSKFQPYYTRTAEIYAMRNDVKPFIRTYFNTLASSLNTEVLSIWECPTTQLGAYGKTHEIGYFLYETRLMFVMERGNDLWLAPFVTNNWFKDGAVISIKNAPTFFGKVSYEITPNIEKSYIDANVELAECDKIENLVIRLRHPEGKRMQRVTVNGQDYSLFDPNEEVIKINQICKNILIRAYF